MSIDQKLKKLNIEIPNAPDPVGAYVAFKKINGLLFISGQLPISSDGKMIKGKIGKDLTLEDGQKASKLCVINILAQVKKALNGEIDKVKNCIKITGYVNSSEDFIDQPKVINPASETLSEIFQNNGKHTRVAVSANSLPLGAAVEIDAIFAVYAKETVIEFFLFDTPEVVRLRKGLRCSFLPIKIVHLGVVSVCL